MRDAPLNKHPLKALERLLIPKIGDAASEVARLRRNGAAKAALVEHVDQLIDVVDGLSAQLLGKGEGADTLYLASLDHMLRAAQDAYVLVLEPAFFGRESVYDEKIGKDRGLHVGAAIISWFLLTPDGDLVESGLEHGSAAATTRVGDAAVHWQSATA